MSTRVNPRARQRDDRAGDPLDGLVNLFDLGIVLAVAFLLAALSSVDLNSSVLRSNAQPERRSTRVPEDSVVAGPRDRVRSIRLREGQRVVGRGKALGTVYRLSDGRTVIVGTRR